MNRIKSCLRKQKIVYSIQNLQAATGNKHGILLIKEKLWNF